MPEVESQAAPEAAPETKSWRWVPLVLVVVVLVLGVALWRSCGDEEPGGAQGSATVKSILHLDTFVVNLSDPEERAYLRVGIDLGLQREIPNKNETPPTALVRDTIVSVLSSAQPDELLTRAGKERLKQNLLHALQERAPALGVEEIYFTEFLIQR